MCDTTGNLSIRCHLYREKITKRMYVKDLSISDILLSKLLRKSIILSPQQQKQRINDLPFLFSSLRNLEKNSDFSLR